MIGMKKREMAMRAINKYWLSKLLRDHLLVWSQEAKLRTVKLFNNAEGPIATETHRLHQ